MPEDVQPPLPSAVGDEWQTRWQAREGAQKCLLHWASAGRSRKRQGSLSPVCRGAFPRHECGSNAVKGLLGTEGRKAWRVTAVVSKGWGD